MPAAIRHAREYLQAAGAPAPVVAYPLLHPLEAQRAPGVRELQVLEDTVTASTARLMSGLAQHAHWAEPYRPPTLRVLSIGHAVAMSPGMIVTQGGQLLDDNTGFGNAELCAHQPPGFAGVTAAGGQILVAVRHRDVARVAEPMLYLPAENNYAAWLFGGLPRLAAYASFGELPILLHGDAAPYHFDSLRAMGVSEARLRIHRGQVRAECKSLIYCTASYSHHAPSARGIRHVREHIEGAPGEARRVYFARRHARDRPLLNEAEVITLLERHGFVAIDPERHSFDEQVGIAMGAEVLAGPYGANLANMLFARNARKLLILGTKHQPEFARLASALGIASWHIVPQAVKIREGRTFSESHGFIADLAAVETALQACLP